MSARGREALARLAAFGHLETLDAPETHSRRHESEPRETERLYEHGLGWRRTAVFRALRRRELEAAEAALADGSLDPEDLAARGRLRRLLGLESARADLAAAARSYPDAEAWLGELDLYADPRAAARRLLAARGGGAWAPLWAGAALIKAKRVREAKEPIERAAAAFGAGAPAIAWLLLGQSRLHGGDARGAREALLRAAKTDPSLPAAQAMLGHAAHRSGDAKEAMARFHAARALDPDVAAAYLYEGISLDLTWDDPEAYLRALDAALAKRPRHAPLYAERAELKRHPRFCLYEGALEDYRTAARLEPRAAWIRAVLGRALNNAGGGRAGLAEFDAAARLAPRSGWIRAWRGAALARAGEKARAAADFAAAERLMPWYSFTYAWRGAARVRAADWEGALEDLDKAVELDPTYRFSLYERFRARRGARRWEEAVADLDACRRDDPKYTWLGREGAAALPSLEAATRARPRDGRLWAWLGASLLELGRAPRALAALDRAARLSPSSVQTRAWRASALAALGRHAEAAREHAACLRRDPRSWQAHQGLAECSAARGDLRTALLHRRKAAALTPTTVSSFMALADAAAALGRDAEALAALGRALELDRGYREASLRAAELCLRLGRLDEAQSHLAAVFSRPEPPARAFAARGLLRRARGEEGPAAQDFRRAYALDPGVFPPEARAAVAALAAEPEGGKP